MENVINNLNLEIKNIDSTIRSHCITNYEIHRRIRFYVVQVGDLVEILFSLGWLDYSSYRKFSLLINNRISKLDNTFSSFRCVSK